MHQKFDKSLVSGTALIMRFLEEHIGDVSNPDLKERIARYIGALSEIQKEGKVIRDALKGVSAKTIETYYEVSELLSQLGNPTLAGMAKETATTSLLTSVGVVLHALSNRGDDNAWLLLEQFRNFPASIGDSQAFERYTSQLKQCLNDSGDDYARELARLMDRYWVS